MVEQVRKAYAEKFGGDAALFVRAPGRINLIGEHTDYNGGFVLPAAVNRSIILALGKRNDNEIHLHTLNFNNAYSCKVGEFNKSGSWPDYIIGSVRAHTKRGINISGFNCVFGGDIPMGGGLSSSAALECGVIYGLSQLFNAAMSKKDIALAGQEAENEFVGVQCGIMDQFASVFGKRNHAIRLDCRDLNYEYVPFTSGEYDIVLIDSGVKHSHASSEYNVRRKDCEEGVGILQRVYPEIKSLRDVSISELDAAKNKLSETVYRRCRYVIEETERVTLACRDLERNNIVSFGKQMYRSHEGLQHEYNVSCPELDFLVDEARKLGYVVGARMMGGGFGGCTINIVRKPSLNEFISKVKSAYTATYGKEPEHYMVELTDGVGLV